MKKLVMLSIIAAFLPLNLLAQDDLYFVPTKELAEQTAREYGMPRETYYIGSRRSVDDYNRRGSAYQVIDSLGNDVIYMDSIAGVYPDSSYVDPDDYRYTERMSRFDDYSPSADFWAGYDAGRAALLSPWYYDSWYSPYRYGRYGYYGYYSWYDPWYDPWYYGYYGYYPYGYRWYNWYGPYYSYGYYGPYYGGYYYGSYRGGSHYYPTTPTVRHGVEYYGATRQTPRNSFGNTRTRTTTTPRTSTSRGTFGASRRGDTTTPRNNNSYTPRNNSYTPPSNNSGSFGTRGGNSGGGSFGGSSGGGSRGGSGGGGGFGRHR